MTGLKIDILRKRYPAADGSPARRIFEEFHLDVETGTEWNARAAALCGAVLGAAAVMAHELRDVLLRDCPAVDPFIHVMTEMAVAVPSGAMLFAGVAKIRNRF